MYGRSKCQRLIYATSHHELERENSVSCFNCNGDHFLGHMPLTLSQREDLNPMNFRCSSFLGQISEKAFTGSDPTLHSRLANILVHKIHRGKDDLGLSVNQPIVQHLTSDGNIRQRVQKAPQDSRRVLEYYVKVVSNSDDKVAEHWIPAK